MNDGYLNARQAAEHVGYDPARPRAFFAWVRRNHVQTYAADASGGVRFKRIDLDRVIQRNTEEYLRTRETRLEFLRRLAVAHARGEGVG